METPRSQPHSVMVEKRKYPTTVTRRFEAESLGSDRWGEWLSVPSQQAVLLLPLEEWWVAWFRTDGSCRVDVAAEVTVGPLNEPRRSFVDLDLDVECDPGGPVRILDEDEFEQRAGAYPTSWVQRARRAVADVAARVTTGDGPFGGAAGAWLAVAAGTQPI